MNWRFLREAPRLDRIWGLKISPKSKWNTYIRRLRCWKNCRFSVPFQQVPRSFYSLQLQEPVLLPYMDRNCPLFNFTLSIESKSGSEVHFHSTTRFSKTRHRNQTLLYLYFHIECSHEVHSLFPPVTKRQCQDPTCTHIVPNHHQTFLFPCER